MCAIVYCTFEPDNTITKSKACNTISDCRYKFSCGEYFTYIKIVEQFSITRPII